MKKYRKTLTVIIILIVAVLMFASFFGVYITKGENERVNLIPNLKLGMEFGNSKIITIGVNNGTTKTIYDSEGKVVEPEEGKEYKEDDGYKTEETKINKDSLKTLENYKKSKEILEKRLQGSNITEYFIDLNELTGKMKVEIPENDNFENVEKILKNSATFFMLDGETLQPVFDTNYFEKAEVVYSQGDVETVVFLQLSFNEEGKAKLEELNKTYIETTEEKTNEQGETETVTNSKTVWVFLNDAFIGATVLPNITYNDKVLIPMGVSNNTKEIEKAAETARNEAMLLNTGSLPLVYTYTNEVKETNISQMEIFVFFVAIGLVFLIAYTYLVVKFKAKGFISVYFQIGFLGILLLIIRLTNVVLTIEGMAGIIISMILEYIFTYIVLKNMETEQEDMYKKANLEFFLNTLPMYVIAVAFTFAKKANINSFGMTLFWGIITIYIYNFIFPRFIFENLSNGRSK